MIAQCAPTFSDFLRRPAQLSPLFAVLPRAWGSGLQGATTAASDEAGSRMSVWTVYRLCVWLPILVPAVVIGIAKAFDRPLAAGVLTEVLAYSLLYGGFPYAVLAVWATWWIGARPESEIRRLTFRAPLLMAAVFVTLALAIGVAVGRLGPFTAVAIYGLVTILPLGYAYVGIAVLLRWSTQMGTRDK